MSSAFRHANEISQTRSRAGYQPPEPIGAQLQRARRALNMTLDNAAQLVGVERRTISLLESGEDAHFCTVAAYAKALGRSLVIDVPAELRHAKGSEIVARTRLGISAAYEAKRWLLTSPRDDDTGLYFSTVTAVLHAYRGSIEVSE